MSKAAKKPQQVYNKEHHRVDSEITDKVEYHATLFKEEADRWFQEIKEVVNFEQDTSKWYGKAYDEPRLTALFADNIGFEYKYSGMTKVAKVDMPKVLVEIQKRLEEALGVHYDFVLVNLYVDGQHKVNWHSDKESTMDLGDIASISLGPAERLFRMRTIGDEKIVFSERLKSGSLVRMKGDCQRTLQHEVPQEKRIAKERINLTFRRSKELAQESHQEKVKRPASVKDQYKEIKSKRVKKD